MGLLLLMYPFFELMSLYELGQRVGFAALMFYLFGTFVLGTNLIRSAGFSSLQKDAPTTVLEAPFRLMAGVLILIPGLLSDVLAFLILIPFVRKILWTYFFMRLMRGRVFQQTFSSAQSEPFDVDFTAAERDVTPERFREINKRASDQHLDR